MRLKIPRQMENLMSIKAMKFLYLMAAWLCGPLLAQAQDPAPREILENLNLEAAKAAGWLKPGGGDRLFYFPTFDEPNTPKDWGYRFREVKIPSKGGATLHGWLIAPKNPDKAKGTVVFSHGNAGAIGHHLGFAMWFAEAGYELLLYDYRGFGKSTGTIDRRGLVEDAHAALEFIAKRNQASGLPIISFGHSLGGAKSIAALAESPIDAVRAVIVDGTFASYQAMARVVAGQLGESIVTDNLAPKGAIAKLSPMPVLIVHGTRDEVVPISQGKELFKRAKQPKTLFEVQDGRHGTSLSRNNGEYRKKVLEWIDEVLAKDAAVQR